jgi:hypothetical protein
MDRVTLAIVGQISVDTLADFAAVLVARLDAAEEYLEVV